MFTGFIPYLQRKDRRQSDQQGLSAATFARGHTPESFDGKLSFSIFLAILCTTILALTVITPAFREFTLSRQNLFDIKHYRLILDTANDISAERGPANIVMSEDPSPTGAGVRRLAEIRAKTDVALAQLADTSLEPPFGLHDHPVPPTKLAPVRDQLLLSRQKVDRIASLPRNARTLSEIQDAIESMFHASDLFRTMIEWRANELVQHDTGLAGHVLVGQMLGDLREYGGRVASQIMAPIATSERMPLQSIISSRQTQGRLIELWQLIASQRALASNPTLSRYRNDVDTLFFGNGLGLVNQLIDEGRGKERYSLTAAEFTDRFVPTMKPIEAYRNAFLDAAVERSVKASTDALITLATVALATTTVLALLIGLILSVRIHIFGPLIQAHEEVIRLAEGTCVITALWNQSRRNSQPLPCH
jgi:hypothetical protein